MKVKPLQETPYDEQDSVEGNLRTICKANNYNTQEVYKNLRAINFKDNFKGYFGKDIEVRHGESYVFKHDIGDTPIYYSAYGDSRVERFEYVSQSSSKITLAVYFKSSNLSVAGTGGTTVYVRNPFIFKANDMINIGAVAAHQNRKIVSVNNATRAVVVDGNIANTAVADDLVTLVQDKVSIFVA
jgi:hypothetical protein